MLLNYKLKHYKLAFQIAIINLLITILDEIKSYLQALDTSGDLTGDLLATSLTTSGDLVGDLW
jgi:hypothetical protein